ncbi:hopanoid biosynthesis associated protein HpnK [candidate division LCP-89 bacterium B3_LCP]|uniref:Hopanoid biosynthesis associated protein HpnK n=1 Tax=candidate division LCP-89 bacterium B3_LCP TaxID=2012998 RepID=A0A532V301_UNCL8|nr:MAG: hopanoid biosynthesis associated protein HpnK [candidate division LCP-89 bacterium B3_LCP]
MPNAKRLIVNSDDLALHASVNRAIFQAHRGGIVTSTTILAGGKAFSEAVQEIKQIPDLGVGLHLCLVDQQSVADPERISSLVDSGGMLPKSYASFILRYFTGRIRSEHIKAELVAQAAKAVDHGLKLTHFDGHQHLHLLPEIAAITLELGTKFGVQRVRIPQENILPQTGPTPLMRKLQGKLISKLAAKRRNEFVNAGWLTSDHFFGFSRGGCMHLEDWLGLIPSLPAGVTEIMVHPGDDNLNLKSHTGTDYHWAEELAALINPEVKQLLRDHNIELINFGDLC